MPLYRVDQPGQPTKLVYAKTGRGARSYAIKKLADSIEVSSVTAFEGAILAQQGVSVETVDVGPDVVMADDPPQAKRGYVKPPVLAELRGKTVRETSCFGNGTPYLPSGTEPGEHMTVEPDRLSPAARHSMMVQGVAMEKPELGPEEVYAEVEERMTASDDATWEKRGVIG